MNSKRSARNQQIADLVFASIIIAIIIILIFTGWGFPKITGIELTIVHIPVLIGAIVLGKKYGILFGAVFGVGVFIKSLLDPTQFAPFTNPILSIVPRILFSFLTVLIYDWLNKLFKDKYKSIPLTMALGSLIHTLLVLPLYYFVVRNEWYLLKGEFIGALNQDLLPLLLAVLATNGIIEIALAAIVGTATLIPLLIIKDKNE